VRRSRLRSRFRVVDATDPGWVVVVCRRCGCTFFEGSESRARHNSCPVLPVTIALSFTPGDLWVGLRVRHDVRGWDGGWWEGWRIRLGLAPALGVDINVDRSSRRTRAFRRWHQACTDPLCTHGSGWRK
jgi:hypothetical protein